MTRKIDTFQVLADNTKRLLKERNMSYRALCEKAGVSIGVVNGIANKHQAPRGDSLEAIANALGVEVYELFLPQELDLESDDTDLLDLMENFRGLDEDGKRNLLRVAYMERRFSK